MRKIYIALLLLCSAMLSPRAWAQVTTYSTPGTYSYTVPAGCTTLGVDIAGAQGGGTSTGSVGGKGGRVQAALAVTPGQILNVYVGGVGTAGNASATVKTGGVNGTAGGAEGGNGRGYGGGGGGSSDVRVAGTALANRVIVAGGGGGAGYNCSSAAEYGGAGGGLTGGTGAQCGSVSTTLCGSGGTQTAGGTGATSYGAPSGGLGFGASTTATTYCGGGGGGYYGGGAGQYGGGGGGSSYYGGSGVSGATTTSDYRTGDGIAILTPLVPTLGATPSSLAFGGVTVATPSIEQSFVLTGNYLSGFPGNVTVTAPAGYELSIEGTLWFSTLSFPFTTNTLTPATVFVRFVPTVLGAAGGNIVVSGGGATSLNIPVTGTGANACTAIPTAGTSSALPTSGGASTVFTLSLSGTSTSGSLTYQWRSSPTGIAGSFTDISGATAASYVFSGLTATTYYQCNVTCPSFGTATSTNTTITYVAPTYCAPSYGTSCAGLAMPTSIAALTGISSTAITDPSTSCGLTAGNYTDRYATMSVTLAPGSTYTASIGGNSYANNYSVQIWIDFNDNGVFTSPGEVIGGGLVTSTATSGANNMTLTIPSTANAGTHRMRIVGNYSGCCGGVPYPGIPSCITSGTTYGETRDYKVVINSPCSAPPAITGTNYVCFPGTTTLSNATSGGTWSSSNTAVATVSASGVVTGVAAGASTITYTVPGGCIRTRVVGVYGKPTVSSITPSVTTICANSALNFTAGSTTGSIVSYSWSGPAGYTATTSVNNTSYTPTSTAGTGSYSVTVTSTSGCVSNPVSTASITVLQSPAPFGGSHAVCQAATTSLTNSVPGGTWGSGSTSIATAGVSSGIISGVSSGLSNITYTLANGCYSFEVMTVNPLPVVTVTPPGPTTICNGNSTSFTASSPDPTFALISQNFSSGLSGWTVIQTPPTPALPLNIWQIVTPATSADGVSGDGSEMLQAMSAGTPINTTVTSPSFSTVGFGSANLLFNQYLLSTGLDVAASIEYSVNGGTSWTSIIDQVGTVVGSGLWTSASPEGSFSLPAGAIGQPDVRLRWNYNGTQFYWFLDNISVTAMLPPSTFAWTGALGLSCTTCTNPTITPTSVGANNYSVTVTSSAGCTTTNGVTVNVNPLPGAITGNLAVCVGTTFTLGNAATGGTWMSSDPSKASIVSGTGVMTGLATGTTTITYTLPTGCYTTAVATVVAAPAAIGGTASVCTGLTTALTHVISGGNWVSSNTAVASINSFGVLTGNVAGTSSVTYTLPSGCIVSRTATVNATPAAIGGTPVVCQGATTNLTDASAGGTWSSSATSIATINGLGMVTGISEGFALVSYTITSTGCRSTTTVTVNPLPAAIGGATNVCAGATAVVTNATTGGTWSTVSPSIATINASGLITGNSAGNTVVSYIMSTTGCGVASVFTVNALPSAISGASELCNDEMSGYSATPAGGTWTTSSSSTLSIDPSSGMATAMAPGNAIISYTLPTGCRSTTGVLVNPLPVAITGTPVVCFGQTTNLYNFTPGGIWSSGNTAVASISPTGVVTGEGAGIAQITYMIATTGCQRTQDVTVNPLPSFITGAYDVCVGNTTTLGNADFGGTWVSSNASVATINAATGVVSGIAAGNTTISYILPTGCVRTQSFTVNALPANISGPAAVCEGQTINWANTSMGGTWSSDNSAIASVDASGVITGNVAGTTTITYTLPTGCLRTRNVVVNTTPGAISGIAQACVGQTSTLSTTPSGGAWTSASSVIAPVSSTGVVTGSTAGATNITYTMPTGCKVSTSFVVNALPAAISGSLTLCEGSTTTLNSATATSWSSSNTAVATVDASGMVSGISAGNAMITCYTASGCERSVSVTVNALPAAISGILNVCAGSTTALTSSPVGGTWSSSASGIASVNSAGVVIGIASGVTNITYTLPTTCRSVASVVVNALPDNITGVTTVCVGQTGTLSNTFGGGNWISANPSVASVSSAGVMTGVAAGSTLVTYALPTGCQKSIAVQVNPLPSSIVGITTICQGNTTLLGSASAGGSWSSSDISVAPIGAGTGAVTGANAGFSIITYTLPTGCYTSTSMVVNSLPDVITGTATVCAGSTTQLESTTGGGTWSSSASTATVNSTGVVTGVAAGTTVITYSTGNNCKRTTIVSINALPNIISGTGSVCPGLTTVLSNANPGGVWTSDNTTVATIGASSGVVSGNAEGAANITYTLPTGCMRSRTINVQPSVAAITGNTNVCTGATSTLANITIGGVWLSSNTSVATVGAATGVVTGVNTGAALITYAMGTGCMQVASIVVNEVPATITGATSVCEGSTTTLSSITAGGSWASSDNTIATISASGVVTGVAAGTATFSYTLGTGCMKTRSVEVNALPVQFNVTGGGSYCAGGTGLPVGLDSSETGATYSLLVGSAPSASLSGTGTALNFGLKTAAAIYTVRATTAAGCVRNMTGFASVAINPLETPVVSMTASTSDTVCAGTSVTYTATGSNGGTTPTYTWSVGSSTVGTGTSYTYVPVNGDEVKITFTSNATCPSVASVSAARTMNVIPNLTPSVNITAADDTVCQGSLASFVAVPVNGGTAPVYTWVVGGSIVAGVTGATYTYLPTNGQTVVCRLNSNYRCPSVNNVSSNTITIRVNPQYIPVVNITAQPGTVVEQGQTVTFTTTVTGGGPTPSYQWLLRGGIIGGATQSSFTSNDLNDGDSVTCVVVGTGECGLETINSVVMKVTPSTGIATTGISTGDIRMMPNPTSGTFTVSGTLGTKLDEQVSFEITDVLGQVVYRANTVARAGVLNERVQLSSSLANGMYMLNISNGNDRKVFHFVLKQ
jgi:trimeric autotransporter adhesin